MKQLGLLFLSWHLGVKFYLLQSKGKSIHPDCQGRVQRAEGEHPHSQLLHLSWDAATTYTGLTPWMAKITRQAAIPHPLQAYFSATVISSSVLWRCLSPQVEEIIFKNARDILEQERHQFLLPSKALHTPNGNLWWETFPKTGEHNVNV